MASNPVEVSDEEIEALMAELEEENLKIIEEQATAAPVVEKPTPAPMVAEAKPSPAQQAQIDEALKAAEEVEESAPVVEKPKAAKKKAVAVPDAEALMAELEQEEVVSPPPAPVAKKEEEEVPVVTGLRHYIDADKFTKDTRVSETNLDACMIEQNSLRAYYGTMAARAESQSDTLKARFEVIEAKLYDEHRKLLLASGEKVTEKMVENAVKMDVRWFKGKNTVIEAGSIAAINKQLVESIKDRRDMIIQLGADRRDEFKGQARIMAADAERDSLKDRAAKAAAGALRERNAA